MAAAPLLVRPRIPHADDRGRRVHPDAAEGPRGTVERSAASAARGSRKVLRAVVGAPRRDERPRQPGSGNGAVQQDGNLGRTDVLVGGGLHWSVKDVRLGLTLQVPVYSHIIGHHGQLSYPGLLGLTAGTTFGE